MKLIFRPNITYKKKIINFLSEVLGPKHPALNIKLFNWYYCAPRFKNLSKNSNDLSFILAVDGDQIISLLGFYEVKIRVGGKIIDGAWAALWYSKESKMSGIGGLLMRKLIDQYKFIGALACSETNQKIVKTLGFQIIKEIPSYVFILNPDNLKELTTLKITSANKKQINKLSMSDKLYCTNSYPVKSHNITSLTNKNKLENSILSTFKDQNYLNWRYLENPFFNYYWSNIELNGEIKAWLVWRIADLNGVKLCRIVDFDSEDIIQNKKILLFFLFDELINYLNDLKCDYIDIFTTNEYLSKTLLEYGFKSNSTFKLPNLIDPPSKDSLILNGEYFLSPDLVLNNNLEFCTYRSDGDVDRPNLSIV